MGAMLATLRQVAGAGQDVARQAGKGPFPVLHQQDRVQVGQLGPSGSWS